MLDKSHSASYAPAAHEEEPRSGRGWKIVIVIVIIVAVVFMVKRFFLAGAGFPPVRASEWQAVFLTNNQVYFGHLKNYGREYVSLNNIFYLRVADALQQGATPPGQGLNLVKLGGELHGPQDTMYVPKDKILFWENLKPDSQVVQAISNFLKQK